MTSIGKLIITIIMLLMSQYIQAEVSISVDRDPVVSDEAFKLVFETNHKHDGEPDFSALEKNFTILSTGRRSNTQIINGDVKRSQQWILTVMAKQSGVLPIPSIRFGSDSSQATSIKVLKSAASLGANTTDDVVIKSEVDTTSPYVQAQVIYKAKVYRSVQTNNAKLFDPEVSGGPAIINRLGEDKTYEERLNGKRYVVTERQFVIFPQNSGTLKIEPIVFQAQIGSSNFFNFDPFGPQPKTVIKRSEAIDLDIKPIPKSFTGDTWLPAKQLSVQEQWSVDPSELIQGEAATRTLTLNAEGIPASNLPEVKTLLPEKLKQYPDQPEFSEDSDKKGFTSSRKDKMAVIPVAAGEYVLPAIKIPWWNTETDKMEFAELPERSIHAKSSDVLAAPIERQPLVEDSKPAMIETTDDKEVSMINTSTEQLPWKWVSLILFILWLFTLLAFWKSKQKVTFKEAELSENKSRRRLLKKFKQTCLSNDPVNTKKALLDWVKVTWPDEKVISINTIKKYSNDELSKKIDELNNCLYGKNKNQFNGSGFLKSFESNTFDNQTEQKVKGKLEPLYKT